MARNRDPNAMCSTVWVGRVKSTCPPSLLQDAFCDFGNIVRVETGFAGFAYVEYDNIDACQKAVNTMNRRNLPGVGEIYCQVATFRGYEDAVRKRDEFAKSSGKDTGSYGSINNSAHGRRAEPRRQRERSSPSRDRASRSRSRSRQRRSASPQGRFDDTRNKDPNAMSSTVWVGRVKSTCPPGVLRDAFADYGNIVRVETGFAGFAYVEYDDLDSCQKAVNAMNRQTLPGVGEIHCQVATVRGYADAVRKRDEYRRNKGLDTDSYGAICNVFSSSDRRAPEPSRRRERSSPSRDRCSRSESRSRSRSRRRSPTPRRPRSRRRSASRSRSWRSVEEERRVEPVQRKNATPLPVGAAPHPLPAGAAQPATKPHRQPAQEPHQEPARQKYNWDSEPAYQRKSDPETAEAAKDAEDGDGEDGYDGWWYDGSDEPPMPDLGRTDRGHVSTFFDGASAAELLLESASVLRAALPDCLNGFPYSYPGLTQEDAGALLNVVAGFIGHGGEDTAIGAGGEKSVEVRQSFSVDSRGRRILRKVIMVDGVKCSSEKFIMNEESGEK